MSACTLIERDFPAESAISSEASIEPEGNGVLQKARKKQQAEKSFEYFITHSEWAYAPALERALNFILEHQSADGSWGHYLPEKPYDIYLGGVNSYHAFGNASSALVCLALLNVPRSEASDQALVKGYNYLITAPLTGRVSGDTFYNFWSHAYMLQAISKGLLDQRLRFLHQKLRLRGEDEMQRLKRLQNLNGGWGYYDFRYKTAIPSGEMATSFCTATALTALHEAQAAGYQVETDMIQRGLDFIERLRFPHGGYAYGDYLKYYPLADRVAGSLSRSQACNHALRIWNQTLSGADIQKSFDDFFAEHDFLEMGRQRQFPHESWYSIAGYYYYYGHFYAALSLRFLPEGERSQHADTLAGFIAHSQEKDGSFWDFPLFGYSRAYGTGYALFVLSECYRQRSSL